MSAYQDVKVSELVCGQKELVSVKRTDSVEVAAKPMQQYNILSLPILGDDGEIEGIVEVGDIAAQIYKVTPHEKPAEDVKEAMERAGRAIGLASVADIEGTANRASLVTVNINDPLSSVATLFAQGVHRVMVSGADKPALISQVDLARFSLEYLKRGTIKNIANSEVESHFLHRKSPAVTVGEGETVINCVKKMLEEHVSSLAVVCDDKALAANISLSDFLHLVLERTPALFESVKDYLSLRSPESTIPVCVVKGDTVLSVMTRLVQNRIHRQYYRGQDDKVSVISYTDLFDIIMQ